MKGDLMEPTDQYIDVRPIAFDEKKIVFDLWLESANWLINKAINQWDPGSLQLDDITHYISRGSEVFLARIHDEVVGTLIICWSDPEIWEKLDTFEAAYIHKLAVNRNFKGLGIGARLLEWAAGYVKTKGKRLLRLDCMKDNLRLNKYYQELGFTYIRCKDLWNINLYEKTIWNL